MNSNANSKDMLKNEVARLCHLYNNCHSLTVAQIQEELTTMINETTIMVNCKRKEVKFARQHPQIQHIQPQVALGYLSLNPSNQTKCIRQPTSVNILSSTERIANLRPIYDEQRILGLKMRQLNEQINYGWGAPQVFTPEELALEMAELKEKIAINTQIQLKLQKEDAVADRKEKKEEQKFQTAIQRQTEIENTLVVSTASLHAPCTDLCAICLETHNKGEIVRTECGHEFGKECWHMFVNSRHQYGVFHCPACRKTNPKVKTFACKKPRSIGVKSTAV
jgi:Ring finger domain